MAGGLCPFPTRLNTGLLLNAPSPPPQPRSRWEKGGGTSASVGKGNGVTSASVGRRGGPLPPRCGGITWPEGAALRAAVSLLPRPVEDRDGGGAAGAAGPTAALASPADVGEGGGESLARPQLRDAAGDAGGGARPARGAAPPRQEERHEPPLLEGDGGVFPGHRAGPVLPRRRHLGRREDLHGRAGPGGDGRRAAAGGGGGRGQEGVEPAPQDPPLPGDLLGAGEVPQAGDRGGARRLRGRGRRPHLCLRHPLLRPGRLVPGQGGGHRAGGRRGHPAASPQDRGQPEPGQRAGLHRPQDDGPRGAELRLGEPGVPGQGDAAAGGPGGGRRHRGSQPRGRAGHQGQPGLLPRPPRPREPPLHGHLEHGHAAERGHPQVGAGGHGEEGPPGRPLRQALGPPRPPPKNKSDWPRVPSPASSLGGGRGGYPGTGGGWSPGSCQGVPGGL